MARAALSTAFAGLSGTLGDLTIVQRPDGPVVRQKVYRPRTQTAAQAEGARRMRQVGEAWRALDDATYAAWIAYAETQRWRNAATGAIVTPKAYNLFLGLASKARQVDPSLSLAGFLPPAQAFSGDGVMVEVEVPIEPLPLPPLPDKPLGEGVLRFYADRSNAPGIVTELLIQPLANARRAVYGDKYVSRGFVSFADGSLDATVECSPGAYACAIRFVREATGQETAVISLGVVKVN